MSDDSISNEIKQKYLKPVYYCVKSQINITNSILDYFQMESKSILCAFKNFKIKDLVDDVSSIFTF